MTLCQEFRTLKTNAMILSPSHAKSFPFCIFFVCSKYLCFTRFANICHSISENCFHFDIYSQEKRVLQYISSAGEKVFLLLVVAKNRNRHKIYKKQNVNFDVAVFFLMK